MVIFGIDPAIRTTGYGLIKLIDRSFEIVDCGVISNGAKLPHSECLRRLYGGVAELVSLYNPDCAGHVRFQTRLGELFPLFLKA